MQDSRVKSIIIMTVLLFVFWLIMAEFASISEWWIGLIASLLVVAFLRHALIKSEDFSPFKWFQVKLLFLFLLVWLKDLWLANIEVAGIVLRKKMDIQPDFYTLKQPLKRPFNQSLFANSITLTPGTLTVDFDDDTMLVHGLLPHHIVDLENSKAWKYISLLEKEDNHA